MKKLNNKGFTLVELIIVIAILAIIMLIAIPNFSGIQQRMQVRADKSTAAQIGKAVRVWFTDFTTDSNMVTSTKAIDDATGTNSATTAPITTADKEVSGKNSEGTSKTVKYVKMPSPESGKDTVTPINYEKLVTIDEYISRGQKPTSLRKDNVQDANQFYGVYLTASPSSTSAKIAIAVCSTTSGLNTVKLGTEANYDGTAAGIAYIEP